jgi:hypothetical protein
MKVTVSFSDFPTLRNEGSVVVVTGTAEGGERVTFAGDRRPMIDFVEAVRAEARPSPTRSATATPSRLSTDGANTQADGGISSPPAGPRTRMP